MPILLVLAAGLTACTGDSVSSGAEEPRFSRLPSSRTGITFANVLEEDPVMNGFTYEYYYNGGGVAVGDLNGDDLPDLYFTGNRVPNRLYLNRGDLRFEDVSEAAGVRGHPGWATGVTFADVNGDGRLDIYVSYSGAYADPDLRRNQLFIHQGLRDGIPRFAEQAAAFGLDDPGMSTQAAFFDYDRDGDLDAYVLNHGVAGQQTLVFFEGPPLPHQADRMYRNDGGRFVDVSREVGIVETKLGFGLGVSVGDMNNDGWPDFYVANDYSGRDYLYLGRDDGRFDEVLEASMPHIPYASMGSDLGDLDGDGWLDLMVLEMAMEKHYDRAMSSSGTDGDRFAGLVREGEHYQYASNALQWNRGRLAEGMPRFSEVAQLAGVDRTDWSWGPLFADLDNDGRPDLFIATGTPSDMVHRDFQTYLDIRVEEVVEAEGRATHSLMQELLQNLPRREVRNRVFRSEGDLAFSDRTAEWGMDHPTYSNGAAYADLDRDGDLDLVVNNLMEEATIYRNETRELGGGGWLGVRFRGPAGNPFGLGARVRLRAGGRQQVQELQMTRGYQSSVEPLLHFGIGGAESVDTLEVVWPDGARELRTDVAGGRYLVLDREDARAGSPATAPPATFVEGDGLLRPRPRHRASVSTVDPSVTTYPSVRDPLALAAADVDGDGRDDFVLGGSGGEPSRVWLQMEDGSFRGVPLPAAGRGTASGDVTAAAFVDADGDGRPDLWLVHEDGAGGYHHRLLRNGGGGRFSEAPAGAVPDVTGAGAVVVAGDYDGDGDEDLFLGERVVPRARAAATGSRLLRNDGGTFSDVTAGEAPALGELSGVTDAAWVDVDGDGVQDLVVVGEWMPVTVLLSGEGRLRDATADAGLASHTGWWQTVAPVDVDGDGDMDLVAGNLGLNYPYRPTPEQPFELFVADFDGDGEADAVPGYYEGGRLVPGLDRDRLADEVSGVIERYPTHHPFASATLYEILGTEAMEGARRFRAGTLATAVLRNDGGGRYTVHPLPGAAQVSAVTGVVPGDFDGDGHVDLVVAGNLYELRSPVPRADAGVGLFLRGDGEGGFVPVTPTESGVLLEGRVRRLVGLGSGPGRPPGILAGVVGGEARYVTPVGGRAAVAAAGGGAPGTRGDR